MRVREADEHRQLELAGDGAAPVADRVLVALAHVLREAEVVAGVGEPLVARGVDQRRRFRERLLGGAELAVHAVGEREQRPRRGVVGLDRGGALGARLQAPRSRARRRRRRAARGRARAGLAPARGRWRSGRAAARRSRRRRSGGGRRARSRAPRAARSSACSSWPVAASAWASGTSSERPLWSRCAAAYQRAASCGEAVSAASTSTAIGLVVAGLRAAFEVVRALGESSRAWRRGRGPRGASRDRSPRRPRGRRSGGGNGLARSDRPARRGRRALRRTSMPAAIAARPRSNGSPTTAAPKASRRASSLSAASSCPIAAATARGTLLSGSRASSSR